MFEGFEGRDKGIVETAVAEATKAMNGGAGADPDCQLCQMGEVYDFA